MFLVIPKGILQKMKEGAENVEKKLQAKVESLKTANDGKGEFIYIYIDIGVIEKLCVFLNIITFNWKILLSQKSPVIHILIQTIVNTELANNNIM